MFSTKHRPLPIILHLRYKIKVARTIHIYIQVQLFTPGSVLLASFGRQLVMCFISTLMVSKLA